MNRNQSGKFTAKSTAPRKVRSVNLTDEAWNWLAQTAKSAGLTRNDWIEMQASSEPLMETANPINEPIMETADTSSEPLMETANPINEPIMETAGTTSEPLMETVKPADSDALMILKNNEIAKAKEQLAAKNQIIEECDGQIAERDEQIENLKSELAAAKEANKLMHLKIEELRRSPAPTSTPIELPDPIEVTNKLNALLTKKNFQLAVKNVARILNE